MNPKNADAVYGLGLVFIANKDLVWAAQQKIKLDALDPAQAEKLQKKIDAATPQQ